MFNIVLVNPEIPPNTGNIIRLCANTGATLHIIEPIGFSMDNKQMKRAGLDYHLLAKIHIHPNWTSFLKKENPAKKNLYVFSTKGMQSIETIKFKKNDWLLFGSETTGLSQTILTWSTNERIFRIPMQPGNRSLNLSNAVAITIYEAWRQNNYLGSI